MSPGRSVASLIVLGLLAPLAAAAQPLPMTVEGILRVNGAPAPEGAPLVVLGAVGDALARSSVAANGTFRVEVPADDPATEAREGAREGEALTFAALGGRASGARVAFEAGGLVEGLALALVLPDLVLLSADASPREAREGDDVSVSGLVANRGAVQATSARVVVVSAGRTLGQAFLGQIPVNATVPFAFSVSTAGLSGNRSVEVRVASPESGDARPADNAVDVPLALSPNDAPVVRSFTRAPTSPRAGEPVLVTLEADDADGIARVTFHWDVGAANGTHVATAAPFAAPIGSFPGGTSVRYWAVVTDASAGAIETTTPVQTFDVADGASVTTPTPGPTPEPGVEAREPWPWLAGLGVVAFVAYLRRRT